MVASPNVAGLSPVRPKRWLRLARLIFVTWSALTLLMVPQSNEGFAQVKLDPKQVPDKGKVPLPKQELPPKAIPPKPGVQLEPKQIPDKGEIVGPINPPPEAGIVAPDMQPSAPAPSGASKSSAIKIPATVTTGPLEIIGSPNPAPAPEPFKPKSVTTSPLEIIGSPNPPRAAESSKPKTVTTSPLEVIGTPKR